MKLPLNCSVDYINDFLDPIEAKELYTLLIEEYKLDQARLNIEAGGKIITTDSFKILFLSERLIKLNSHPDNIHGKGYVWSGLMKNLKDKIETLLHKEFEIAMCIYYPMVTILPPIIMTNKLRVTKLFYHLLVLEK